MTVPPKYRSRPNWRNPVHLLAYGLGSGAVPKAPGTFGTLAAIPLYLSMSGLDPWVYLGLTGLLFALGTLICGQTAHDLGQHDPGGIVWDEWVGLLVTLWLAPPGWVWLAVGFLLFRLFDIWKPWPIRWLDRRVYGGLGIMVDDLLAGIYAFALLQGGHALWNHYS